MYERTEKEISSVRDLRIECDRLSKLYHEDYMKWLQETSPSLRKQIKPSDFIKPVILKPQLPILKLTHYEKCEILCDRQIIETEFFRTGNLNDVRIYDVIIKCL